MLFFSIFPLRLIFTKLTFTPPNPLIEWMTSIAPEDLQSTEELTGSSVV
jgi:hypothetical protein